MKILVVSHGEMCLAMLGSAAMIAGSSESVFAVNLTESGIGDFTQRLQETISSFGTEQILILSDIQGGTPYNESLKYALTEPDRIALVSGVNLPMLIEISLSLDSYQTAEEASKAAILAGISSIQGLISSDEEEDDLF